MSKILISDPIDQSGITFLQQKGYDVVLSFEFSPSDLLQTIGEFDALIVRSRTKVTAAVIEKGTALKVIGRAGVGVDNIDVVAAKEHHIQIVNTPSATTEAVAEHTMGLLLSLARQIPHVSHALNEGIWEKLSYKAVELQGKTLGIVGFGHIGSRVAQLGAAFGMHILATTRAVHGDMQKELDAVGGKFVSLEELLKTADVVTLHVPLTEETKHMIGKKELELMKKTAFLVNTARGDLVEESALITALTNNEIVGAALDVFHEEPLPNTSPLFGVPHGILTPHIASISDVGGAKASLMVAQAVAAALV